MINDVKWVQAQRHASDWRLRAGLSPFRPLITFGAAAPCYLDGIIENTLKWGPYYLIRAGDCAAPCRDRSKALTIIKSASLR